MLGQTEAAARIALERARERGKKELRTMCRDRGGSSMGCEELISAGEALTSGDLEELNRHIQVYGAGVACTTAFASPFAGQACMMGMRKFQDWINSLESPDVDPERVRITLNGRWRSGSGTQKDNFARDTVEIRACSRKQDIRPGEIWLPWKDECWPLQVFFPDIGKSIPISPASVHPVFKPPVVAKDWDGIIKPVWTEPFFLPYSPNVVEPGTIYIGPGWFDLAEELERRAPKPTPMKEVSLIPGAGPPRHFFTTEAVYPAGSFAIYDAQIKQYRILSPT